MPELPEVETIRRGISPALVNNVITSVIIRQHQLRWRISDNLSNKITNQCVSSIARRGKYLLINFSSGTLIIHLGMSGRLLLLPSQHKIDPHEHVTINFSNNQSLCYVDPRRFGAILWTNEDPLLHELLLDLGPEPLSKDFSYEYLYKRFLQRKTTIKQFIMDSHNVVGVGNIYANEALFLSQIRPDRLVKDVLPEECSLLVKNIKQVLITAIKKGGTTIKDYVSSDGHSGYFQNELKIYGRAHQPCLVCGTLVQEIRLGQRSTFFCKTCQK